MLSQQVRLLLFVYIFCCNILWNSGMKTCAFGLEWRLLDMSGDICGMYQLLELAETAAIV